MDRAPCGTLVPIQIATEFTENTERIKKNPNAKKQPRKKSFNAKDAEDAKETMVTGIFPALPSSRLLNGDFVQLTASVTG